MATQLAQCELGPLLAKCEYGFIMGMAQVMTKVLVTDKWSFVISLKPSNKMLCTGRIFVTQYNSYKYEL